MNNPIPIRKSYIDTATAKQYAKHLKDHHPTVPNIRDHECLVCALADIVTRLAEERDDLERTVGMLKMDLTRTQRKLAVTRHSSRRS